MNGLIAVSDEWIAQRIYVIRNKKVMLDRDLADLYGFSSGANRVFQRKRADIEQCRYTGIPSNVRYIRQH